LKITSRFEIGDEVYWDSSGNRKWGVVVAVIPAGVSVTVEKIQRWWLGHLGTSKLGGGLMPRRHESYLIQIRKSLYWPRVAWLREQEEK
jgi:hypothetical protein